MSYKFFSLYSSNSYVLFFFYLKKLSNSKFPSLLKNAGLDGIFPFHSPPPHQAWPEDEWPLSSGGRIRKTRNRTRLPIPWLYSTARLYQKTELDLYRIYFFGQTNVGSSRKVYNAKSVTSKHRLRMVARKRNNYIIITTLGRCRQRYKLQRSGFYYSVKPWMCHLSKRGGMSIFITATYSRFRPFNAFTRKLTIRSSLYFTVTNVKGSSTFMALKSM